MNGDNLVLGIIVTEHKKTISLFNVLALVRLKLDFNKN